MQEETKPETSVTTEREPEAQSAAPEETKPEEEKKDLPAPPPEEKQAEEPVQEKAPEQSPTGSGPKKVARERFSVLYPYRRVKMDPRPGIQAEFAGELIWPIIGTPFLDLLGD